MTTIIYIAIAVAVVALIVGFSMMTKRRNESKKDALRVEAGQTRDQATATRLEAARQGAVADERTAHAKAATLAAQQQRNDAASTLTDAQTLQRRADEIDPDVTTR